MISISLEAGVIQLVECQLPKLDVAGSIPVPRSMFSTSYSERSKSQSLIESIKRQSPSPEHSQLPCDA